MSDIQHIKDLTPDPNNARRHNPRNIGLIERSLNEVGAGRSIVVDEDGVILAGNGLVEAAAQAGISRVRVVEADGNEIIAVRRRGLTAEQKTKMALFDNRTAELAEWEPDILAGIADMGFDLSSLFTDQEWADVSMPALPDAGAGGDEFDAEPEDGPTRTALGELYVIGGVHRLLVGDCTIAANVARLMGGERADMVWTDPPYNVDAAGSTRDPRDEKNYGKGERIENDAMNDDDFITFLQLSFHSIDSALRDGGAFYVAHPDRYSLEFRLVLRDLKWHCPQTIIWVKDNFVFGRNDYHPQHEQVLYGWKSGAAHYAVADRTQSTVWQIAVGGRHEEHPTEKPLELVERALLNSSKPKAIAVDFFAGSGVTLTAAHRTNRRAYLMEIAPRYADVILRRATAEGLECERVDD